MSWNKMVFQGTLWNDPFVPFWDEKGKREKAYRDGKEPKEKTHNTYATNKVGEFYYQLTFILLNYMRELNDYVNDSFDSK